MHHGKVWVVLYIVEGQNKAPSQSCSRTTWSRTERVLGVSLNPTRLIPLECLLQLNTPLIVKEDTRLSLCGQRFHWRKDWCVLSRDWLAVVLANMTGESSYLLISMCTCHWQLSCFTGDILCSFETDETPFIYITMSCPTRNQCYITGIYWQKISYNIFQYVSMVDSPKIGRWIVSVGQVINTGRGHWQEAARPWPLPACNKAWWVMWGWVFVRLGRSGRTTIDFLARGH